MTLSRSYIENGWFREAAFRGGVATSFKIKEVLHSEDSPFQKIDVLETEAVGRLLLLDGKTMVSELDEAVYHESITHIPYMGHPNVKNILIVGGGDGGAVREFARYPEIEKIDLVEIDQRVIDVSREYFPQCTIALDDPRVTIHALDGIQFIKDHKDTYDIIIIDSTDPVDFAEGLFKAEFYAMVAESLRADGIMTAQTENPFYDEYGIKDIYDNLRSAFPIVQSFWAAIPIYPGVFWSFAFASKKYRGTELLTEKLPIIKKIEPSLTWYNHRWHQGAAFNLSTIHRKVTGVDQ